MSSMRDLREQASHFSPGDQIRAIWRALIALEDSVVAAPVEPPEPKKAAAKKTARKKK
jgi:hypothetical protein